MIFYFSSTGNSKYVAQRIAEECNDELVDIAQALKKSQFDYKLAKGERLGFVIPTYYWNLPSVVEDFVSALNIDVYSKHYTYVVATCGVTSGMLDKDLALVLKKKKLALNASFAVRMVDNFTPIFDVSNPKKNEKKNDGAEPYIDEAIRKILCRASGDYNRYRGLKISSYVAKNVYYVARKTDKFEVNDKCISCGQCEKLCPCNAILLQGGKPVWVKEKCTQCLGCLHRCPMNAISYGKNSRKHGQYVNSKSE